MPNYWFFFSYATTDTTGDPWLKKFFEELAELVRKLAALEANVPRDQIGFFAGDSIHTGDEWPDALIEGLQVSRVLVYLLSPKSIQSIYCGREFQVFKSRWDAHTARVGANLPRPPVILPVRWMPVADENLPPALRDIQNKEDSYGPRYAEIGLYQVRKRYPRDYQKFLWDFANRLVEVASKHPMDMLADISSIKSATSAFHDYSVVAPPDPGSEELLTGPKIAQFIFVAGRPSDFSKAQPKRMLECYSDQGGRHWRPYLPAVADDIGFLAQSVAARERFQSDVLRFGKNLIAILKEAEQSKRVVVIIVDNWTLLLRKYSSIMRQYDSSDLLESAVLVLQNGNDPETAANLPTLQNSISKAFPIRAMTRRAIYFRHPIRSKEQLVDELISILQKAKMRIIQTSEILRRPEGEIIPKPEINGPGKTVPYGR